MSGSCGWWIDSGFNHYYWGGEFGEVKKFSGEVFGLPNILNSVVAESRPCSISATPQ